jgi:hypothetical protein
VGVGAVVGRIEFDVAGAFFSGEGEKVLEKVGADAPAAVVLVDDEFIDVGDGAFRPKDIEEREGAEGDGAVILDLGTEHHSGMQMRWERNGCDPMVIGCRGFVAAM